MASPRFLLLLSAFCGLLALANGHDVLQTTVEAGFGSGLLSRGKVTLMLYYNAHHNAYHVHRMVEIYMRQGLLSPKVAVHKGNRFTLALPSNLAAELKGMAWSKSTRGGAGALVAGAVVFEAHMMDEITLSEYNKVYKAIFDKPSKFFVAVSYNGIVTLRSSFKKV